MALERRRASSAAPGFNYYDQMVRWVLNPVCTGAFDLELAGLGIMRHRFGDGHRSVFLSGEGCKPLVDLAGCINRDSNRPPHLTLGRFRQRLELPPVDCPGIVFRVERLALVKSIREGADFG